MVFPGTNSEDETLRACRAAGLAADLVHWSAATNVAQRYDGYVLCGGFAYEDRIRAGAVAAHHRLIDVVIAGAQADKPVLGICNGAQILLETGLVPGTGAVRRPTAAFAPNDQGHFVCKHVYMRVAGDPARCRITAGLPPGAVLPAWAAHGEGRLVAQADQLAHLQSAGHIVFTYANEDGTPAAAPNGSSLDCAGITNVQGNVLAVMPHCERDGWTFQHRDGAVRSAARGDARAMLAPSGGSDLFTSFARAF